MVNLQEQMVNLQEQTLFRSDPSMNDPTENLLYTNVFQHITAQRQKQSRKAVLFIAVLDHCLSILIGKKYNS